MSRVILFLLPLALAATAPQKAKSGAKPLPKPKVSAKPTSKSVPSPKPLAPTVDPKVLQKVLASAGTPAPATESGLTSAMVEAVAAGKGRIDYSQGVARAVGLGALRPPTLARSRAQDTLDARDAALADALRTLTMAVQQVRVTADSRVSNYTLKSDEVRLKLAGIIKNAEVVEEKLLPESGIYRMVVQVPLVGANSVAEAVGAASAPRVAAEPREKAPEKPRDPFAPGMPAPSGVAYTGLIVDCRGLGLKSSPSPKLWSERGDEVFGTITVSEDFLQDQGIVAYPHSLEAARRSARIGERPLIVRARRCHDATHCEPLISHSDAQRIREANQESKFLERCAVVFVTDP